MAHCLYIYKNVKFTEDELDDFLLGGGKEFLDTYGDWVFSETTLALLNAFDALKKGRKEGKALREAHMIAKRKYDDNDLEPFDVVGDGYHPVSHALEGVRKASDGQLLFPEFIADNYFAERRKDWENGKFNPKEMSLLFPDGNVPDASTLTESDFNEYRKQIEDMWDAQGKIGSEIHKAMQYFFSGKRTKNSTEIQFRDFSDADLKKNIAKIVDTDLLPESRIQDIIESCRLLDNHLRELYGNGKQKCEHLKYFTEYTVSGEMLNPETLEVEKLIGSIDLIVLDDNGNIHIIDYKTSPNDYNISVEEGLPVPSNAYSPAKKLAFAYLLNIYSRLLKQSGIITNTQDVNVVPLQLANFRKEGDSWKYDAIKLWEGIIDNLTLLARRDATVNDNLDGMFKESYISDIDSSAIIATVNLQMSALFHDKDRSSKTRKNKDAGFKDYINTKRYSVEDIIEFSKDKIIQLPNGKYLYKDHETKPIIEDTIEKVLAKLLHLFNSRLESISREVNRIKIVIQNNSIESYSPSTSIRHKDGDIHWIVDKLKPYCTENYRLVTVPKQFDYLGIILLENIITGNYRVLKISKNNLSKRLNMGPKRTKLTGKFEDDIVEDSNSNSLMLDGTYGNVELIETLLALNTVPKIFAHNGSIEGISVINTKYNEGVPEPTNKELLYSFNKLISHLEKTDVRLQHNYIKDKTIKFLNLAELFRDQFRTQIANFKDNSKWSLLSSARDLILELAPNPEEMLPALMAIRTKMEDIWHELKNSSNTLIHSIEEETYMLLNRAITELLGYDFRLLVGEDYKDYIDTWDIRKGHSGLLTDNPGVTKSLNLNMVTKVVTLAYLNVRSNMLEAVATIRRLNKALKQEFGLNYLAERTYGNKVNLYRNMYVKTDTDWVFVNPDTADLSKPEKDFLEYALATINANRYPTKTVEQLLEMRKNGDPRYFRVPLTTGGSVLLVSGLMKSLENVIQSLMPKEVIKRFRENISNLMSSDSEQERNISLHRHWEMTTMFDGGESDRRLSLLAEHVEGYYEHDLEKLLLKHVYAYTSKREIDKVFPLIKTAVIHLLFLGIGQNSKFENSIKYLLKYVETCIFNRPDISDRDVLIREYVKKLMHTASVLALGFAPRLLYQAIEGIWKDIGLILEQPDGKELNGVKHFSLDNMVKSFFTTFTELTHFGNGRSLLELINELYALNDMDMNVYAQHLEDGHNLIYNFSTFLFRMASRPDFYNRLTIFLSLMRADGCWEAHKVVDGKLVYDWKLDKRFDILAQGSKMKNHPKYRELEMLYLQMARLMEIEGTRNADGTLFKMRDENGEYNPLPKAYTTLQSESYKALSDRLYGYYSHEKRSLMLATLIGGLFMQMYTYWSGKKNLFLAPGSVKNLGKYIHVTQTIDGKEVPMYYQLKSDGTIDFDAVPTEQNTGVPVIQWRGTFSEGVITTLANIGASLYNGLHNGENTIDIFKGYWDNADENLRTAYRANLTQLAYDMFVFMVIGGYFGSSMLEAAKVYVKDNTTDTVDAQQVLLNTNIMLAANIFKASVLDLNFAESIFGRGLQWTPFSFQTYTNLVKNWGLCLGGEREFRDAVINSFSATRQTKPFWQFVWPKSDEE